MNATAGERCLARFGAFALIAFLTSAASTGETTGITYFETKIRPLLASKCQGCHGAASRMAGLDLSSAAGFRKGADSGPLAGGSNPKESRLLRAVGYEGAIKMPPSGKLKQDEIAALGGGVGM